MDTWAHELFPVCLEVTVNIIGHDEEKISRQLRRMYNTELTESLSCSKQAIEDCHALAILESFAAYDRWSLPVSSPLALQPSLIP